MDRWLHLLCQELNHLLPLRSVRDHSRATDLIERYRHISAVPFLWTFLFGTTDPDGSVSAVRDLYNVFTGHDVAYSSIQQWITTEFTDLLADTECVAYTHIRWRRRRGGSTNDDGEYVRQKTEESVPFYVEDGGGRALVNGPRADFALKTGDGGRNSYRDKEAVLETGEPVYVFGEVMRELPEPSLGDGAFGNAVRAVGDAISLDEATKREFAETVREGADRLSPRDGEFIISDAESGYDLFVSDGTERAGERRQLLEVAMYGGLGVLLLALVVYIAVSSVL